MNASFHIESQLCPKHRKLVYVSFSLIKLPSEGEEESQNSGGKQPGNKTQSCPATKQT